MLVSSDFLQGIILRRPVFEADHPVLSRIHRKANVAKNECYFVGFIEGILANKRVDETEIAPLLEECRVFCDSCGDDDAREILEEAQLDHHDAAQELFELLDCIRDVRGRNIDRFCLRSSANRVLGFCAGIACDGIISPSEVRALDRRLKLATEIDGDSRLIALRTLCRDAVEDGVFDADETVAIAQWIGTLVGDTYADTGFSSFGNLPNVEDIGIVEVAHFSARASFVLTGTFEAGPRSFVAKHLADLGGVKRACVSGKTDLLVIGNLGSPNWKHGFMGDKVAKAVALRASGKPVRIVKEAQLKGVWSDLAKGLL